MPFLSSREIACLCLQRAFPLCAALLSGLISSKMAAERPGSSAPPISLSAPPPITLTPAADVDVPTQLPLTSPNLPGQPLLSGWVRLYPAASPSDPPIEKVWLVATDMALHVRFGRASLEADDVLSVGAVSAAPSPSKGYRVALHVRKWKGPQPWLASPRAS